MSPRDAHLVECESVVAPPNLIPILSPGRRATSHPRRRALGLLCAAALAGCASASFDNGVFRGEHTTYRVGPVGADWRRVSVDDNDLAFYSRGKGTIGVNATCTDYEDVPKAALLNHLLFGTEDRVFRVEDERTVNGRGARHAVVDAELDGAPITLEVFLLVKGGCVYDLSLVTSRDVHQRVQPEFHRFVRDFEVLADD